MDVLEYAKLRQTSLYSIDKYMPYPDRWRLLLTEIVKLKAAGAHALAVSARFDIASLTLYNDSMLSWILLIYNGIKRVGAAASAMKTSNANITLQGFEVNHLDARLDTSALRILISDSGAYREIPFSVSGTVIDADVNEDGRGDLHIELNESSGQAKLTNLYSGAISFRLTYPETVVDDYMIEGTQILYPNKTDVDNLLKRVQRETQEEAVGAGAFGFNRL